MTLITDTNRRDVAYFLAETLKDIVLLQAQRGLRASGLSASSLAIEQSGDASSLVDGAGYFEYQERGRGPGRSPLVVPKVIREKIYQWLAFKKYGLDWSNESERKRLAYLIARKIQRRGTYTFIKGDPTGVLSEPITTQRIDELLEQIGRGVQANVESDVVKSIIGERIAG